MAENQLFNESPKWKKDFIRQLSQNVVNEILADIDAGRVPENWDGIELRILLAERFKRVVFGGTDNGRSSRIRRMRNEMLTRNL